MAKLFTYTMLMVGIMAVLQIAGFGLNSQVLPFLGNFDSSQFITAVGIGLGAILLAWGGLNAISATFFGRTVPESVPLAFLCSSMLGLFVADMLSVYKAIQASCGAGTSYCLPIANIMLLFMTVFSAGYIIALVQWWRGNDIS